MSRLWLLVFLLFVIVFTSQFEWKRQFGEEIEPTSTVFIEDQYISKRQESVKENVSPIPFFSSILSSSFFLSQNIN
ncbi:hypothetical protein ES319_A09G144400v1 [Gossypium barbadense]|uniref:Uncharacterized protein n=2 Tax=Gossypium TaxID=3633 RepID=A0A5J5UEK0_GOSBA|nr:hypothetical protein ES319_A09G144400v1 [Gossypium barbadense]TYH02762.1 hypothetical protein ES288_A09G166500v1 [Gossypium darwinii]